MSRVLIALVLTLVVSGCAGFASTSPLGADGGTDSATGSDSADTGPVIDANSDAVMDGSTTPPTEDMGFPGFPADPTYSAGFTSGEARSGDAADPATRLSCFDGLDNDSSRATDCSDPICQSLGSCCVGRGDCCADLGASSPLPPALDVSACMGSDGFACITSLTTSTVEAFGFPGSFLDRGALAPGGDATGDAGLLLGDAVDLRTHAVTLEADLTDAEDCDATCLESVAFGWVVDQPMDRVVRPLVALLLSPSLHQVRLVIGDAVVKSFTVPTGSVGGTTHWTLSVSPEGRVRVESDVAGVTAFEATFAPIESGRMVVYGRSRNPSASSVSGARINNLTAQVSLCDMPSAWQTRQPAAFFSGGNPAAAADFAELASPSLARDETAAQTFAAFVDGGSILIAAMDASGVQLDTTTRVVADVGVPWQAGGFDSPALLRPSTRPPEVYFTAHGSDGVDRIGVAVEDGVGGFDVLPGAALDPATFGLLELFEPTAFEYGGPATLLLARARDAAGTHLEAFYRMSGATNFTRIDNGNLGQVTQSGSEAADADEVLEPSLVLFDHAWHLYVAQRRGTRYSIGLLASDELVAWRWVARDALTGSGTPTDFDSLGVRSPAALRDGDAITLLYVGLDGAGAIVGQTSRVANSGGATP